MDGLTLLRAAEAAGLTVNVNGDRLVIRGPRSADATARALLEHKPEVMAALAGPADAPRPPLDAEGLPVAPCRACGGRSFWRWPQSSPRHHPRAWFCYRCTPIPPEAGPCDACCLPPTSARPSAAS